MYLLINTIIVLVAPISNLKETLLVEMDDFKREYFSIKNYDFPCCHEHSVRFNKLTLLNTLMSLRDTVLRVSYFSMLIILVFVYTI